MANGRCRFHGGATPSGDQWHKPQAPRRGAPLEKLDKKEAELKRRRDAQRRRRWGMSEEERARHEDWHASHAPGLATERDRRRRSVEARNRFEAREAARAADDASVNDGGDRPSQPEPSCDETMEETRGRQTMTHPKHETTGSDAELERIRREQHEILVKEHLPVAIRTIKETRDDASVSPGTRLRAAQALYDRAVPRDPRPSDTNQAPSLTAAQIAAEISRLEAIAAEAAREIEAIDAEEAAALDDDDVFS